MANDILDTLAQEVDKISEEKTEALAEEIQSKIEPARVASQSDAGGEKKTEEPVKTEEATPETAKSESESVQKEESEKKDEGSA